MRGGLFWRAASRSAVRWFKRVGGKEWIEKWMNFQSNFERLVLFCIEASDSESRRNRQHFSRSTRLTFFCTAPISKFQLKIVSFFCENEHYSIHFSFKFSNFLWKNAIFRWNFNEILPEFREIVQKMIKITDVSWNLLIFFEILHKFPTFLRLFIPSEWKIQSSP